MGMIILILFAALLGAAAYYGHRQGYYGAGVLSVTWIGLFAALCLIMFGV